MAGRRVPRSPLHMSAAARNVGRHVDAFYVASALVLNALGALPRPLPDALRSFVAAGRAARDGLDPHGTYPRVWRVVHSNGGTAWGVNPNPPLPVLLFRPLAGFDVAALSLVMYGASLALYGIMVWLLARRYRQNLQPHLLGWVAAPLFLWDTLAQGQIYVPLAVASVGAWLLSKGRHHVTAGVLLGCVIAIKPNLLVVPVLLGLAGWWATGSAAVACAVVLCVVPLAVFGTGIYAQWWQVAGGVPAGAGAPFNASLAAMLSRLGAPNVALPAAAILLAGLALWARGRRPVQLTALGAGLVAAILASPVGWQPYVLFALPLFFWWRGSPLTELPASVSPLALLLLLADLLVLGADGYIRASTYCLQVRSRGCARRDWPQSAVVAPAHAGPPGAARAVTRSRGEPPLYGDRS